MITQEEQNILGSLDEIRSDLIEEFQDPDFRDVYVDEFLNAKIATQIKVLREQRGLKQEELGRLTGMKQERISVLEDINYESWTLSVLRRFAKAFDLRLDVEFKDFGSFFSDYSKFNRESLERTSFENDKLFSDAQVQKRRGRFKVMKGHDQSDSSQRSLFRPQAMENTKTWEVEEYRKEAEPLNQRTG